VSFIVPSCGQSGFRERFFTDVGHAGLRAVRYVSQREQRLAAELQIRYGGGARDWELTDLETGGAAVSALPSSTPPKSTARSPPAASAPSGTAEQQLHRVKNGLDGRYYKTLKQVDARVARIIAPPVEGLITTRTATRNSKPILTWTRNHEAITAAGHTDGIYALATNLPGARLTAGQLLRDDNGQQIVERVGLGEAESLEG
jgi:hypothetical protein